MLASLVRTPRIAWHRLQGGGRAEKNPEEASELCRTLARLAPDAAISHLASAEGGLEEAEAARRLQQYGPNSVAQEKRQSIPVQLLTRLAAPLNVMLLGLSVGSYLLGDPRAAIMIAVIVGLSVGLSFIQEYRSNKAAAALRAMVRITATVLRQTGRREIPIERLVPGDLVSLAAGDMVPADLRLIAAKDLFLNEAALTGEALPAEKFAHMAGEEVADPLDLPNSASWAPMW